MHFLLCIGTYQANKRGAELSTARANWLLFEKTKKFLQNFHGMHASCRKYMSMCLLIHFHQSLVYFLEEKNPVLKGTVRPDWICMRVVSLESPLKAHQLL